MAGDRWFCIRIRGFFDRCGWQRYWGLVRIHVAGASAGILAEGRGMRARTVFVVLAVVNATISREGIE